MHFYTQHHTYTGVTLYIMIATIAILSPTLYTNLHDFIGEFTSTLKLSVQLLKKITTKENALQRHFY